MSETQGPWGTAVCLAVSFIVALGPLAILTGLCCLIASLSTSHWVEKIEDGQVVVHGGLFEVCFPTNNDTCMSWDDSNLVDDTVYAKFATAALIIACVAYLAGFFVTLGMVCSAMDNENPSLGGNTTWGFACILNSTGLGMFVKFQNDQTDVFASSIIKDYDFGYSFHLCWICLVLVVVGCGIAILVALCCTGTSDVDNVEEPGETNGIRQGVYGDQSTEQPVSFVSGTENVKTS